MIKVPCQDCEDRVIGCHSICEKYDSYRKEINQRNELIEKNKTKLYLLNDYECERAERIRAIDRKQRKFKHM